MGYFTYICERGCSTIDYIISNYNVYMLTEYVRVSPQELSDHCLIEACSNQMQTVKISKKVNSTNHMRKLRQNQKVAYELALLESQSQDTLIDFLQKGYKKVNINIAVKDFTNIIIPAGKKVFKVNESRHGNNRKSKSQNPKRKWFDTDCTSLRSDIRTIKRNMTQRPFDIQLQQLYLNKCRKYKKLLKQKQRCFRDNLVGRLVNMANTNPSEFWRILDTLKNFNNSKISHSNNIEPDEWFQHLKTLASKTIESNEERKGILDELSNLENSTHNDYQEILNKTITISEVKSIIKQLKNRKSRGDDLVINKMLKFGVNRLVPALTKLFNLVLESGIFPCDWNTSFQVPLYRPSNTHAL